MHGHRRGSIFALSSIIQTDMLHCCKYCMQVTAAMDEVCVSGVRPALGMAWAEQVTMRLMLTRSEGVGYEEEEEPRKKVRYTHNKTNSGKLFGGFYFRYGEPQNENLTQRNSRQ